MKKTTIGNLYVESWYDRSVRKWHTKTMDDAAKRHIKTTLSHTRKEMAEDHLIHVKAILYPEPSADALTSLEMLRTALERKEDVQWGFLPTPYQTAVYESAYIPHPSIAAAMMARYPEEFSVQVRGIKSSDFTP